MSEDESFDTWVAEEVAGTSKSWFLLQFLPVGGTCLQSHFLQNFLFGIFNFHFTYISINYFGLCPIYLKHKIF